MSIRLLLQAATYADQPIRQKYHFHNSYELIFIRKGAIRLTVEQKQYIMSAGSLAIISCLENHSTEILSKEYERYYIFIATVLTLSFLTQHSARFFATGRLPLTTLLI